MTTTTSFIDQLDDTTPVRCDNCSWTSTAAQLKEINDLSERLSPGGVVPAGECPECGALAYVALPNLEAAHQDKTLQELHEILCAHRGDRVPIRDPHINQAIANAREILVAKGLIT
jgi:hypothetical protein